MTAHRVVAVDDPDGIALSCLHPACDFAERGFGHVETALPVGRLHEAEGRIEELEAEVARLRAERNAA